MAIVFAENILTLWIGSVDPEIAIYMQIMLCAILVTFFNFGSNFLVALNVAVSNLVKYRVGQMLLRATALAALISWLGLLAAPIAMAISSLLTVYLLVLFRKVFSMSIMRQLNIFMKIFFVNIGVCILFFDLFTGIIVIFVRFCELLRCFTGCNVWFDFSAFRYEKRNGLGVRFV